MSDVIESLLGGTLADPDGGPPLGVPTRSVTIAESLAGAEAGLVRDLGFSGRLAVIADPDTGAALGARVEKALAGLGEVLPVALPAHPHPDLETAERVIAATAPADALVAVGSGTINDLAKYTAARTGKPYAVFATAPSMNGYTSVNAAITVDGHKKSLPATAAAGVFMDLSVLAAAPSRLIRSGLGDSLYRPTAQADWLLAHLACGRPYREAPFALLAADEAALFAEPEALLRGDLAAMRRLARTLVLSGFGMTLVGSSHPASEGEHLISHYADMMGDPRWPESYHGEQIGVTTLAMARLQARLLDGPPPVVRPTATTRDDVIAHFGPVLGESCWREFAAKRLDATAAEAMNARFAAGWETIRERIAAAARPPAALEGVLAAIGAPRTPRDLGWPDRFYRDAVVHARLIRDRYTFLDLAADTGVFAEGFAP